MSMCVRMCMDGHVYVCMNTYRYVYAVSYKVYAGCAACVRCVCICMSVYGVCRDMRWSILSCVDSYGVRMRVYEYIRIYVDMYVYVCMCIYGVCMCMYGYVGVYMMYNV